MQAELYYIPKPYDHGAAIQAMAHGLDQAGVKTIIKPLTTTALPHTKTDFGVVFGVEKRAVQLGRYRGDVIKRFHNAGKSVMVIERGWFDRNKYYSVGWDGLNGHADFCVDEGYGGYLRLHGPNPNVGRGSPPLLEGMRKEFGNVLLCGQVPWDATVQDSDHIEWCRATYKRLTEISRSPVVFRGHPLAHGVDYGLPQSQIERYEDDLRQAAIVVTFNSTTGALAALEGIPIVAVDKGSIAYDIAENDIENINDPRIASYDERIAWVNKLSWCQWSLDDMALGRTWNHLERKFK
jgi:hypothetical protein